MNIYFLYNMNKMNANANAQNYSGNQQNLMNIINCKSQNEDSTKNSNRLHQQLSTINNVMNCNDGSKSNMGNHVQSISMYNCKYCGYSSNRKPNVKLH